MKKRFNLNKIKTESYNTIVIDNNPIDVVSEGDYITKGHKVVVTQVTGNRVVVRPVTE